MSFGGISVRPPQALAGQRIGLMGGSFNPPHSGHVLVARTALRRLGLDRVWWLVTPGNPLKNGVNLNSASDRMGLVRKLVADRRMVVSDFEERLGTAYTAETIAFLRRRFPATRFVWIMGADSLAGLHHWRAWREIAQLVPLAVIDRPGWRLKALASPAAATLARWRQPEDRARLLAGCRTPSWTFLTTRLSETSSTDLRRSTVTAARGD